MLCQDCEERLAKWERRFALDILRPVEAANGTPLTIRYGEWFSKFAASLVWRVVTEALDHSADIAFKTPDLERETREAAKVWKEFILDRRSNPGRFELHTWSLNVRQEFEAAVFYRDFIVEKSFFHEARTDRALVLVKLPRLIVEGTVRRPQGEPPRVTRMKMRHGFWSSAQPPLPDSIRHLLNQRARQVAAAWNTRT
jgi:hypothetical protein